MVYDYRGNVDPEPLDELVVALTLSADSRRARARRTRARSFPRAEL